MIGNPMLDRKATCWCGRTYLVQGEAACPIHRARCPRHRHTVSVTQATADRIADAALAEHRTRASFCDEMVARMLDAAEHP